MKLSSHHLKRYKDIARLLIKYSRSDVVQQFGFEDGLTDQDLRPPDSDAPSPAELADDLEALGPTFVKLGQVLSSRPDLLPPPYIKALTRLQDKVKPFSYEDVERTVHAELGVRISKAFSEFEREPLAAASLGQVHRAALRDGRAVVVKVQRPDIRRQIAEDMDALEEIATLLDRRTQLARRYQFVKVFEEFRQTLIHELDYEREATNLLTIARNLEEFPLIRIPLPVDDYTTRSVLTMEYLPGTKITKIGGIARLDIQGSVLAEELFRAYLKQVLIDGVFHADPHPGNVFLTYDGQIALLDLGMVGRTSPQMQEQLIKLLIAISEGQSDAAADVVIRMSDTGKEFNQTDFTRKVAQVVAEQQNITLAEINVGRVLLETARNAAENGIFAPTELTLLGKTLLQLDEIGRQLDPNFNPNDAIRRNVMEITNRRMKKTISTGALFGTLFELKDFVTALPTRLNKILDTVANAEFEIKVRATDASELIDGFQKIANRITTGLILAALIIGASLLMQVQTSVRIFGYPALAILFFLLAAGGGLWLVVNILVQDHKRKRQEQRRGTR